MSSQKYFLKGRYSNFKKHYTKRYGWRTTFRAAMPVANWCTGSAAYDLLSFLYEYKFNFD